MNDYRPPRRQDYEPIVKGMIPFCEGDELTIRAGLLMMRDRAMATKAGALNASGSGMSSSSWALLEIVEREASESAFQAMKIEDLQEFRRLCVQCVTLAQSFDRLYQPALPDLVEGEAHAGG